MARLHRETAKWQMYELDEHEDGVKELDVSDRGNVNTRLLQFPDESGTRARFAEEISLVCGLCRKLKSPCFRRRS
jgi:hypothetical protein